MGSLNPLKAVKKAETTVDNKYSKPQAPDYAGLATQQGDQNVALLREQTAANRPTINTPWGSQSWTQTPTYDDAGYEAALKKHQEGAADPAAAYYRDNPDVQAAGIDAMEHYNKHGKAEGRTWYGGDGPDRESFKTGSGWTQNINLTPEQQKSLEAEQRIQSGRQSAAEGLLGQATDQFKTPMDWSKLHGASEGVDPGQMQTTIPGQQFQRGLTQSAGDWRQQAQDAVTEFQRPQLEQRRSAVETQLRNQGLTEGSEAWNNAMRQVGDEEARAGLQAFAAGRDEAGMLFGQDLESGKFANDATSKQLTGDMAVGAFGNNAQTQQLENELASGKFDNELRQMGISEEQLRRGMTLNELNALLSGQQVQNPSFSDFSQAGRVSAPDLVGAGQMSYEAMIDAFNAQQQQRSSDTQAAAGAASLFGWSDRRLKKNLKHLFTLPNGIKVYSYHMLGSAMLQMGVIAQEVEAIMPKAVKTDGHGYLMVNYDMVLA